ncbi:response regulator transcription factor [Nocardioides sp.]|uniref:response regulator transcription factor n=1 Tax=Nocardioides sp. TaxID=35761 RepID=UPI00351527DB
MTARAIVIEDAPEFAALARHVLEDAGYDVTVVADGADGVAAVRSLAPEMVMVDLGLPRLDGIEVCRQVRTFSDAYLMVVTGRDGEAELVKGFEAGADDYVTKPYSPAELGARVSALQRRPRTVAGQNGEVREYGPLRLDPAAREVSLHGQRLHLTRTEFDILDRLTSSPGTTVSRTQLSQQVWGAAPAVGSSVLDVHVGNLRKKLGEPSRRPRLIVSVRGVGFRFEAPETEALRSRWAVS